MKKYIEVYSSNIRTETFTADNCVGIVPDRDYIGMIFIVEGDTFEQAHEQASIASYTLRIDNNGKLQLSEDE